MRLYYICYSGMSGHLLVYKVPTDTEYIEVLETRNNNMMVHTYRNSCAYETTKLETSPKQLILKSSKV